MAPTGTTPLNLSNLGIAAGGTAPQRLQQVIAILREMSRQTDPQALVQSYAVRMREIFKSDQFVSFSRRNVPSDKFRITRSSQFKTDIDPWKHSAQLPVLGGGILGELIYGEEPRIINDFHPDPTDPAYEHLKGMRSLAAIPHYDGGKSINMVAVMRKDANGFDMERFPELVLMSGLFGRATHNLALTRDLLAANAQLERELQVVARIQRSLLPSSLPELNSLQLATHYQPSANAGGDMFDFFDLPGGRLGILIADVSGHGTPAAVVMAVVHALAHSLPGDAEPAAAVLSQLNKTLTARYTTDGATFVTAFYGVFDPAARTLHYSSAGHNPPLVLDRETGTIGWLSNAQSLPLGIDPKCEFIEAVAYLDPGDALVLYTDGITEAKGPSTTKIIPMYGEARLETIVRQCAGGLGNLDAPAILRAILTNLDEFTLGTPPSDDRTIVVGKIA